jgi:hypothetical protein
MSHGVNTLTLTLTCIERAVLVEDCLRRRVDVPSAIIIRDTDVSVSEMHIHISSGEVVITL